MRVKLLLALAIASIVLMCSASVAFAACKNCGDNCKCTPDNKCSPDCGCFEKASSCDGCGSGTSIPGSVSGIPSADQLTAAANNEIAAFGFPDLTTVDATVAVPLDTVDATRLDAPLCGVCGECPPCSCEEKLTVFEGPKVNLGCPVVAVTPVPVDLVSPVIKPVFPEINVAPQVCLALPQVNAKLNCFDIDCQPCTDINECPPCPTEKPRPTATPKPTATPRAR